MKYLLVGITGLLAVGLGVLSFGIFAVTPVASLAEPPAATQVMAAEPVAEPAAEAEPPAAAPAATPAPIRILPLGDSLTDGYSVPGGYRAPLWQRITQTGVAVDFVGDRQDSRAAFADPDHQGVPGAKIADLGWNLKEQVERTQPDAVLLLLGTNDMVQDYEVGAAPARIGALLDTIAAAAPRARVLVGTLPPLYTADQAARARDFNAALPALVQQHAAAGQKVALVDLYHTVTLADLPDGVHPTADGYARLAEAWYQALLLNGVVPGPTATPWAHGTLKATPDGHGLMHADGTPFFWLGDTAWELFHRGTREEVEMYLENRHQKGFNVVQVVALSEFDQAGLRNTYGADPLVDHDPAQPLTTPGNDPADSAQYDYWDHVDYVFDRAAARGIYVAILPTWGSRVEDGPDRMFDATRARAYGQFLGSRYGSRPNVIWILGGDRPVVKDGKSTLEIWRALAAGIQEAAPPDQLMTYHPSGDTSSSAWLHDEPWLDFNMFQSGHRARNLPGWDMAVRDYARQPAKPVLNGEPNYEDHPVNWRPENGYFRDFDVRLEAYRSVFAGAFGITYGEHSVWQLYEEGRLPWSYPDRSWQEGLDRPGAVQMTYLRRLMESRPLLGRVPDQGLVTRAGGDDDAAQATRGGDGSYAFVYLPRAGQSVEVDLERLSGKQVRAWWFDPRTGSATAIGEQARTGRQTYTAPQHGPDWVLVLDDAGRGFPPPGTR